VSENTKRGLDRPLFIVIMPIKIVVVRSSIFQVFREEKEE